MRKTIVAAVVIIAVLLVTIVLLAFFYQSEPADSSIKMKTFLISDSEQWIFEEFQGRRFQLVTYEEGNTKKLFLIEADWFLDHDFRWQVNPGQWYKDGIRIAISSKLNSNFTSERMDNDFLIGGLSNLEYQIRFDAFQMNARFSFNTTVFNNATHAWRNSALELAWQVP